MGRGVLPDVRMKGLFSESRRPPVKFLRRKRPHYGLLNVCLISPGDTNLPMMRIAPMQKINFREYLAVATALVIIVAFFHQWVLTF